MDIDSSRLSEQEKAAMVFMHRAAAAYRPHNGEADIILEAYFTDIHKTYQLVLTRTDCILLTEGFRPYTARAEASYPIFEDLIKGRRNPAMALLKGQVKAKGDLKVLKRLEEYFPGLEAEG